MLAASTGGFETKFLTRRSWIVDLSCVLGRSRRMAALALKSQGRQSKEENLVRFFGGQAQSK
jgi:hypothetical protein